MGDYLSPVMEGFSNPTMNSVFREMLKTTTSVTESTGASGNPIITEAIPNNIRFLRSLIEQQKDLADSLISSSKKIGPISQNKVIKEDSYDSSFETDISAPLPTSTATLQGFTLLFFIISFLCLAIVFSIHINNVTYNTAYAVYTFIGFLILFIVAIALIIRLA